MAGRRRQHDIECLCLHCGQPMDSPRPNKFFHDSSCRGKATFAGEWPGGPTKALESARRSPGRRVRRKHGTDLYVVRDEIELVRDLLTGKPAGETPARDRLIRKIPRALERIERAA